MASISATISRDVTPGCTVVTWALGNADSGLPFSLPAAADLTCHTFGKIGRAHV